MVLKIFGYGYSKLFILFIKHLIDQRRLRYTIVVVCIMIIHYLDKVNIEKST